MSRRTVIILVSVVVAVLVAVLAGPPLYSRWQESRNPEPIALTSAPVEPPAAGPFEPDGTWTVTQGSEAGYRVEEVLRGEDVTVVGRSKDVTGEVVITEGELTAATVTVQAATIETGVGPRDSFLRDTLQTETFPTATFELGAPVALPELAGERVELEVVGTLTIRDVAREVTVSMQAQRSGDGVRVGGSIPVTFTDFEIEAPNLGFVQVEDAGTIEMLLVLARA